MDDSGPQFFDLIWVIINLNSLFEWWVEDRPIFIIILVEFTHEPINFDV
jgi:hypothetical protein